MVKDILDTSRLNSVPPNEQTSSVNVGYLLHELCDQYMIIAKTKDVELTVQMPDNLIIETHLESLKKAISNILSNAVMYTAAGKSISVSVHNNRFEIRNECTPIPEEHLMQLFKPFYRPDYSRSRDNGGNGLGLYIVDTILDSLNLPYSFSPSQEPLGMLFTIELPSKS